MEFSENQVSILKGLSIENYISEVVEHCEILFPLLTSSQKNDSFRSCIKKGIIFSNEYGYTQRGPVRLYIDMMIVLGSQFESDPLFQSFKINREKGLIQIETSVVLYALLNSYLTKVHGDNGCFFKESIDKFKVFNINCLSIKTKFNNAWLHEMLRGVYPQRYDFAGCAAVSRLISLSVLICEKYNIKRNEHRSYLVLIMFLFGCFFDRDIFRGRFITEPLKRYFESGDINNHNAVVSAYASFQINNS